MSLTADEVDQVVADLGGPELMAGISPGKADESDSDGEARPPAPRVSPGKADESDSDESDSDESDSDESDSDESDSDESDSDGEHPGDIDRLLSQIGEPSWAASAGAASAGTAWTAWAPSRAADMSVDDETFARQLAAADHRKSSAGGRDGYGAPRSTRPARFAGDIDELLIDPILETLGDLEANVSSIDGALSEVAAVTEASAEDLSEIRNGVNALRRVSLRNGHRLETLAGEVAEIKALLIELGRPK